MKFRTISAIFFTSMMTMVSCQNEEVLINDEKDALSNFDLVNELDNNELMNQFGLALSKVTFENQEVREFLKEEAISQFDKNYDILWVKVKDEKIGNKTLRDILVEQTSEAFISQIEEKVPQLNVLFPKIAMFGIEPEKYNSEDNELPVVVPNESCNLVYFDGECADTIQFGDVPDFNVLVINENSRVIVNNDTKTKGVSKSYSFIDPAFDGSNTNIKTKADINIRDERFTTVITNSNANIMGKKVVEAYSLFNNLDRNSDNSVYLQRDYLYYGLTPSQQTGVLKTGVKDYITFIEINPKAYFNIADQNPGSYKIGENISSDILYGDPIIRNLDNNTGTSQISRKKKDYTFQEIINELWTKGVYNIKVEIISSTSNRSMVTYIPVKPEEIWFFNLDRKYRHPTFFKHHSKYTYTINPNNFTSRTYFLDNPIPLGNWDLSKESLYKYILFSEEDLGMEISDERSYEMTFAESFKFTDNLKIGLGLDTIKADNTTGIETSNSNTRKETIKITRKYNQSSDDLGSAEIYFYDPIVYEYISQIQFFTIPNYNTGIVKFGITTY
ncbi:MAG: hypothetical protein K5874_07865 [Bacteroidaceae bacterium]|nr:hypothetical protein [Bacteroidaceae bacterium]